MQLFVCNQYLIHVYGMLSFEIKTLLCKYSHTVYSRLYRKCSTSYQHRNCNQLLLSTAKDWFRWKHAPNLILQLVELNAIHLLKRSWCHSPRDVFGWWLIELGNEWVTGLFLRWLQSWLVVWFIAIVDAYRVGRYLWIRLVCFAVTLYNRRRNLYTP